MAAQPVRPEWESLLDPKTGLLKSQYQMQYGPDITANSQALDALRSQTLSQGPSAWAQLANQQQGLQEAGQRSGAAQQAASSAAQARSGMASKYGLSQGANQSLARQNMRDQMNSMQNIAAQGAQQRGQIGLQDAAQKQQALMQLPGMEVQATAPQFQNRALSLNTQQFNVGGAANEVNQKRQADLSSYNDQMKAWAAQQQADAIRNSGSGGKK